MQGDFAKKIKNKISQERLSAYQKRIDSTKEIRVFSHYIWNMTLSESLYSVLHVLEITLRNTIHNTAADHFECNDWFLKKDIISGKNEIKTLGRVFKLSMRIKDSKLK